MKSWIFPVVLFVLIGYLVYDATMNFALMAIIDLLLLVATWGLYRTRRINDMLHDRVVKFLGILVVACATVMACWTLSNYFFASNDVYSNCAHHAVRIDGVKLLKPKSFVLAGNSKNAFFDNENFHGTLRVKEFNDECVVLKSQGFTQAVYLERYDGEQRMVSGKLLNKKSLIPVQPTDKIRLIGSHNNCQLSWAYQRVSHWIDPDEEKCKYLFQHKEVEDTMSVERVVRKGLSLNTIYGEAISDFNFEGLNLLRETYEADVDEDDYFEKRPFVLELNDGVFRNGIIKRVEIVSAAGKKTSYRLHTLSDKLTEIVIPMNKAFTIGCIAGSKTLPVRFVKKEGSLMLEYVTPRYHRLASLNKKGSNNLFITSSLSREIIENSNPPENIMLFDFFNQEDNVNNFKRPIYLSYVSGSTKQSLQFLVNNSTQVEAGQVFPHIVSADNSISWNILLENFKTSSDSVNENHILIFFALLGLYLLYNLSVGGFSRGLNDYTIVELTAYVVTLLLFSFRVFLIWRVSVFPPVEIASVFEMNHFFRNPDSVAWQFIGLNFFLLLIQHVKCLMSEHERWFLHKPWLMALSLLVPNALLIVAEVYLFGIHNHQLIMLLVAEPLLVYALVYGGYAVLNSSWTVPVKELWAAIEEKSPGVRMLILCLVYVVLMAVVVSLIMVGKLLGLGQLAKILVPVLFYFIAEFVIWMCFPTTKRGAQYVRQKSESDLGWESVFAKGLGLSVVNGLVFSLLFVILDGGYGIMFVSFVMLVSIIKLYDFVRSHINFKGKKVKYKIPLIILDLVLAVSCVVFFYYYKNILSTMAVESYPLCILYCFIVFTAVYGIIIYCLFRRIIILDLVRYKWTFLVLLIVSSLCVVALKEVVLTNHTLQRVMVCVESAEEGLKRTETPEDERRFFDASVNDYILYIYNKQADNINIVGDRGTAYFKMQQHSRVGAMFGAQTSDILTARFIIAEHGKLLPVLFILCFLAMFLIGMETKTRYRASKMLLIQLPLLLFVHALFVWLANKQTFVFLGQDFPLLSLHSKLAIFYYFVLMAIWVIVALVEKHSYLNFVREVENERRRYYYNVYVSSMFFSILAVLMIAFYFVSPRGNINYTDKKLDLESLLDTTEVKIKDVDYLFSLYQDSVHYKPSNLSDVSKIVSQFHNRHEASIKSVLGDESSFYYRLWDKFAVKGGAKNNSSNSLIHARVKGGKLVLSVKKNYFDQNLPVAEDNVWKGSVVASSDQDLQLHNISQNDNFTQYILPDEWIRDDKDVVLLKQKTKKKEVIRNDNESHANFAFAGGYARTCRRFQDDIFDSEKLEELAVDTYFARNVMINGHRSFIYPMSERFFWAHSFASELSAQKNRASALLRTDPVSFNRNVPITIDRELTSDIYHIMGGAFNRDTCYMSAIVADGNGQVRAMVDRKSLYVLNPNNRKEMNQLHDDLYMYEDPQKSDSYFGNLNLLTIKDGPGSSQKPIVWTAVASGIDYDWKNLQLYKFNVMVNHQEWNNGPEKKDGNYWIRSFGGERMYSDRNKHIYKSLISDENRGAGISVKDFMHHSSNFYNSLMLYIGSYPGVPSMKMATASQPDPNAMFVRVGRADVFTQKGMLIPEKYNEAFPLLTKNQGSANGLFKLNRRLSHDYENSLLSERLNSLFGFNSGEKFATVYSGANLDASFGERRINYAYAANQSFRYNFGSGRITDRIFAREALHQAAVGGASVWQVSPFFMAQNFGRLVMLNKNFKLSLNPADAASASYEAFTDLSRGFKQARPAFLLGMNQVFSPSGTTRYFEADQVKGVMMLDGYYLYGKTGTSNETGTSNSRLHRLGVVITDKPIHTMRLDELKDVKYYVVYFTSRFPANPTYKKILKQVIASDGFKTYMGQKK